MKSIFLFLFSLVFIAVETKATQQEDEIPTHDTFTIASKNLGETRTINVWKPAEQNDSTKKLPVLYMLDGGIKEDFPHLANTIMELVNKKIIPPIILVGIENTQRRRDLTGYTDVAEDKNIAPVVGGSAKFRAFIKDELFLTIDQKYRVNKEKSIIGESLAGLFIVETLLIDPDMFDNYIAFDPSLWWNNGKLTDSAKKYISEVKNSNKHFWFASSSAKDIYVSTAKLAILLTKANLQNFKWNYVKAPKEKHDTIFKALKEKALTWTFDNN